jgi:hypothetical protein
LSDEAKAIIGRHEADLVRKAEQRNTPSQKKKTFYYKSVRRHYVSSVEATGKYSKPPAGTRKAGCTQRSLEERMDKRINEEPSSDTVSDPDYVDVNVDEEEEEEELLEIEENPVDNMQVLEAALNWEAYLDQAYVLPPDAEFEEHDLTYL